MPRLDPMTPESAEPVTEYGCSLCQRRGLPEWHIKGLDPLFEPHLAFQGKHSHRQRPPTVGEVFRRLVESDPE